MTSHTYSANFCSSQWHWISNSRICANKLVERLMGCTREILYSYFQDQSWYGLHMWGQSRLCIDSCISMYRIFLSKTGLLCYPKMGCVCVSFASELRVAALFQRAPRLAAQLVAVLAAARNWGPYLIHLLISSSTLLVRSSSLYQVQLPWDGFTTPQSWSRFFFREEE